MRNLLVLLFETQKKRLRFLRLNVLVSLSIKPNALNLIYDLLVSASLESLFVLEKKLFLAKNQ